MYVRAQGGDIIGKAEKLFGEVTVITKDGAPESESAFVVREMPYGEFNEKLKALESDGVKVLSTIRIGDL